MSLLHALLVDDDGQDLIEYGLLAAFISLVVIGAIETMGGALNSAYVSFSEDIDGISTP
jgi:Flp pilus assembly pilin Flp